MSLRFDVISLFPDMFSLVRDQGVTGRAHARLWSLAHWNPRDFTHDAHRTVDDRPYGGGPGMVMMIDPLAQAVQAARLARAEPEAPVLLMSPTGRRFDQAAAQTLAQHSGAILICGRYEGLDQRFIDHYVTDEVSLGDFVLSGGEIAALAVIDATVRLLPGVLNDGDSAVQDSFHPALDGLLDSPHYTRPESHALGEVPAALMSGHHAKIARWRRDQSLRLTQLRRPELIEQARAAARLTKQDEQFLRSLDDESTDPGTSA